MRTNFALPVLLLLCAPVAQAALVNPPAINIPGVSTTGDLRQIATPADISFGTYENNDDAFIFVERIGVTINDPQFVTILPFNGYPDDLDQNTNGDFPLNPSTDYIYDSGVASTEAKWGGNLATGTYNSYMVQADKDGMASQDFVGTVTFDQAIAGIIYKQTELCDTDATLGNPGTIYASCGSGRIFELDGAKNFMLLSEDQKTLTISMGVAHNIDNIRILTASAVPVPAAVWLFGSALGLLGWLRRRTR